MLTKKDFEVTDPKEIFSVDIVAANKALQENFADKVIEIDEDYKAGIYDHYTSGVRLLKPFKYVFYPIFLQIITFFQFTMVIPTECYIYIARKIFKHNFTQDFRKKYMKKIYEKFNNFLKIELNYKHITKEVYNLKKEKLDKYIEFYEWETFEQ